MLNNKTILLADDDESLRKMSRFCLEKMGNASVKDVVDGSALVELAVQEMNEQRPFDFILSDYNMPNLRGIAAIRKLRKIGINTPGMIVTGNTGDLISDKETSTNLDDDRRLCQINGIERLYLMEKPYNPKNLIQNIAYILNLQ